MQPDSSREKSEDALRTEYTARRATHARDAATCESRSRALSVWRIASFCAALALLFAVGRWHVAPAWVVFVPVGAFAALVVAHERVARAHARARRAVRVYDDALARLDDRWAGRGDGGESFLDPHHPYAVDLDVFGRGSLFELLCTARTASGQHTLAQWLLAPAAHEEIARRHAAIEELRERRDLREDVALAAEDLRSRGDADALATWGEAPPLLGAGAMRVLCLALPLLTTAAIAAYFLRTVGPIVLTGAIAVHTAVAIALHRRTSAVVQALEKSSADLALLAPLAARIEREPFVAHAAHAARETLRGASGARASHHIVRLRRYVDMLESGRNQMFAPFAALLLWSTNIAYAIESWRADNGPRVRAWIDAIGTMEALIALATFADEHADYVVPTLAEGTPLFDARALGHPLLPRTRCVTNDVRLDGATRVLIVSGSNMSGKSTLLRAVGVNAVLAFAGAPVRAHALTLAPCAIGASVVIRDSLQEGNSRFYAELQRMRQIVDTARSGATLFLLDEVFHGTNSHDRRIGVDAVVRELVARGAIGLVTTHDLALAELERTLAPHARNVHFVDHLDDGRMTFDYRMHDGVVQKSNALELMRAVGLAV